jgi:hypothetical protein
MTTELGIRMKVLRNTGRLADALNDETSLDDPDQEEFEHLIVMPKNPLKGKCASFLRILFFGLIAVTLMSVSYLLIKDHLDNTHRRRLSVVR